MNMLMEIGRALLKGVFYLGTAIAMVGLALVYVTYWILAGEKLDLFPIVRPIHTGRVPPDPEDDDDGPSKHPDRKRMIGGRPTLGRVLTMDEILDEMEANGEEPF